MFFDSVAVGWDERIRSDSPEYLYYDRGTRLVGIGPAAKRSPAALNLKTGRGGALLPGRYNRVYASACPTIWLGRKVASTAMFGVFQEVWCGHTGYV